MERGECGEGRGERRCDSYRTLVVIIVGEVVLEAQKMGSPVPPTLPPHSLTHSL